MVEIETKCVFFLRWDELDHWPFNSSSYRYRETKKNSTQMAMAMSTNTRKLLRHTVRSWNIAFVRRQLLTSLRGFFSYLLSLYRIHLKLMCFSSEYLMFEMKWTEQVVRSVFTDARDRQTKIISIIWLTQTNAINWSWRGPLNQ